MTDQDALWAGCLEEPADVVRRGVLADKLQDAGFVELAGAVRGRAGLAFVLGAASMASDDAGPRFVTLLRQLDGLGRDAVLGYVFPFAGAILEDDDVSDRITRTNAFGWGVESLDGRITDSDASGIRVAVRFLAGGDPDPERPFCGSRMEGTATSLIRSTGEVEFHDVRADLVDWGVAEEDDQDPEE